MLQQCEHLVHLISIGVKLHYLELLKNAHWIKGVCKQISVICQQKDNGSTMQCRGIDFKKEKNLAF